MVTRKNARRNKSILGLDHLIRFWNAELNFFLLVEHKVAQHDLTFHTFFCPDVDIDG
jgi:hypothetical protein